MEKGSLYFIILFIGGLVLAGVLTWIEILQEKEISDELHELDCKELKKFILSEEDPSQHALNHWTVCTAGGWK